MEPHEVQAWKENVVNYKNGRTFASLDEMLEPVPGNGRRWANHDLQIIGPLDGNVFAIERYNDKMGELYYSAFLVDPAGLHTLLDLPTEHTESMEFLVTYLQSPEFRASKTAILLKQGIKPHEYPTEHVAKACGKDKTAALYISHERFLNRFSQWQEEQRKIPKVSKFEQCAFAF
ncbi:hypothetical protein ACYPKM_04145 [Pseudomonas aeruginosa]